MACSLKYAQATASLIVGKGSAGDRRQWADLNAAVVDPIKQGAVAASMLRCQRQVHQCLDRPVGAQRCLGQLERLIGARGQASVELLPEALQRSQAALVRAGIGVIRSCRRHACQSGHRGHRLASESLHEPEDETATVSRHGDTSYRDNRNPPCGETSRSP
jgi:hypothetical protein